MLFASPGAAASISSQPRTLLPSAAPAPEARDGRIACLKAALLGTPTWGQAAVLAGFVAQERAAAPPPPPPSPRPQETPQAQQPPPSSLGTRVEHALDARHPTAGDDGCGYKGALYDDREGTRPLARVIAAAVVNQSEASSPPSSYASSHHVAYTLQLGQDTDTTIQTRYSQVTALHNALREGWRRSAAPGYTKQIAALAPSDPLLGRTLLTAGRSCLDPAVTHRRAAGIATYLSAVLAEPRLRAHPAVQSFLDSGRRQHLASTPTTRTATITDTRPTRLSPARAAAPAATAHCASPPAAIVAASSGRVVAPAPSPLRRVPRCHDLRNCITPTVHPKAPLPTPTVHAAPSERPMARAFRLLLDNLLLTPLLETQDIRQLSMVCRGLRCAERQITSLRPRPKHTPASPALARTRAQAGRWREGLERLLWGDQWVKGEALRLSTLRRKAARRAAEEQGWDGFLDALESGRVPPGLEQLDFELHFDDRDWLPALHGAAALRLARGLQYLPNLRDLDLNFCKLGSKEAAALAQGLAHTPRLRLLDLHGNPIGDQGAAALAAVLPRLPELQILSLGHYKIGAVGALAVAQQLKHLPQLKFLAMTTLRGHHATIRSALDLFILELRHLPLLERLILSYNCLGDDGAFILASVLPSLPNLRTLKVSGCGIGNVGIRAIANVLSFLPCLKRIFIGCNDFGDVAYAHLKMSMARTHGVVEMDPITANGGFETPNRECLARAEPKVMAYRAPKCALKERVHLLLSQIV